MFHNIDAEMDLIRYGLTSVESCGAFVKEVNESLFEDVRARNLYRAVAHYFLSYKGILDTASLSRMIEMAAVPEGKRASQLAFLEQVLSRPPVAADKALLSMELLRDLFIKRSIYDKILEKAKQALAEGKSGRDTLGLLASEIYNIVPDTHLGVKESRLVDAMDSMTATYLDRKNNPSKFKGVPFGMSVLDKRTSGMFKGELSLFFGRTGAGKSRVMVNVAANAAECGYRVMYVTIEMPLDQITRLVAARNLMISYEGLRKGNLRAEEEQYLVEHGKATMSKLAGDLYIVDVPQGCTVAAVSAGIRKYKQIHGQVDLVVVDYLNLMHLPSAGRMGRPEILGDLAQQLKELARSEDVPVLTAAQANRKTIEKEDLTEVGTGHISWSDIVPSHCDLIVYFEQPKGTGGLDACLDAVIVKHREGSSEVAKLGVDWDHNFIGDLDKLAGRLQNRFNKPLREITPLTGPPSAPISAGPNPTN